MNNIEEILWNYIDGNCTTAEMEAIGKLISDDEHYSIKYQELLALNKEFMAIELDEPSMAFTYNVMETVRADHAKSPLKSAINQRIITGISIFFGLTIAVLLVFTFSNISLTSAGGAVNIPAGIKTPDLNSLITKPVKLGLVFFDVILGLYLFDKLLRNKRQMKQV